MSLRLYDDSAVCPMAEKTDFKFTAILIQVLTQNWLFEQKFGDGSEV